MHESWVQQLESWREFYLLTGTAGVTLTGLLLLQRHKYRRLPRKAGKNDSKQPAGARTATGLWG
jgi:hypothetical protein